jgi:hypothetical protein
MTIAQPATTPTDTQRLLELARYCRSVLKAYLEGESEDLGGLVTWIEHEIEAVGAPPASRR